MKVRELLIDESKWTRGSFAKDKTNTRSVEWDSPEAACFCLEGALIKCYPDLSELALVKYRLAQYLYSHYKIINIPSWNDYQATFEQVKELINDLDI